MVVLWLATFADNHFANGEPLLRPRIASTENPQRVQCLSNVRPAVVVGRLSPVEESVDREGAHKAWVCWSKIGNKLAVPIDLKAEAWRVT